MTGKSMKKSRNKLDSCLEKLYFCTHNHQRRLMKRTTFYSLLGCLSVLFTFASCGQDRSGEYYALVGSKNWIYEVMQEYYLFYQDLPAESELDFFLTPSEFLSAAASDQDQKNGVIYSHVDSIQVSTASRALSEQPTFGYEAMLVQAENGDYGLQVLYTQPSSPAEEVGLKRGDLIIGASGAAITSTDYEKYVSAPTSAYTFTLGTYNAELAKMDTIGQVEMPAPRIIEINNLLKTTLIDTGSRTAAYILYNEFGESDATQWQSLYSQLVSMQPDDIILDLRYNPGGYVSTARTVTTLLAPQSAMGQTMLTMTSNDLLNQTETYTFDSSLLPGGTSLSYQNLYIITTSNTASASETLINCLRPYMSGQMYQVGEATFGKNVAQALYTSEEHPLLELWLTTFYMSNSEGYYDYAASGLTPDYEASEPYGNPLGELGTTEDVLLQPVLTHMTTGAFPTDETTTRTSGRRPMRIIDNGVARKPRMARLSSSPMYIHP